MQHKGELFLVQHDVVR